MIELFEYDQKEQYRPSSKGNQLKWFKDGVWYKADYTGYEGLAEYVVSELLKTSTLDKSCYQEYHTEKMQYKYAEYLGCSSRNFLPEGCQMITLERLFMSYYGESLMKSMGKIQNLEDRVRFLVNQVEKITNLHEFGSYLCKLLTVDTLFLNEDRHMHNIAVLIDSNGKYQLCPIFDNGGCLLSDTTIDYPLNVEVELLIKTARSKTFCGSFDEQLDVVEHLYGQTIKFNFTRRDVKEVLDQEPYYSEVIKKRVLEIIQLQSRKYQYLFL